MIFTREETEFLNRLILARSQEIAAVATDAGLDAAERNDMVEHLTSEVNVIRAMVAVGNDMIDELNDSGPNIMQDVGAMLSRDRARRGDPATEDELDRLMGVLGMQFDLVTRAYGLAALPGCGLDESDEGTALRLRVLISELRADGNLSGMEAWNELGPALDRLDAQCSVLLRIRSMGPVSNEELHEAAHSLFESLTDHSDWMLTAILPDPHLNLLRRFRLRASRYVTIMYARCIVNTRNPEIRGDRPPGGRIRRPPTPTCWRS